MNKIIFYFLILPIAFLPYSVLYIIADIFAFIIFDLIGYRNKIINKNINQSFPEKTTQQIKMIKKKFYSHFMDLIVESFKGFIINEATIKNRLQVNNQELVDQYYQNGRSIILVGGHYNNWEICAQCAPLHCKHQLLAIYKKLKNKFFDNKIRKSREKFGLKMIPMRESKKYFINNTDQSFGVIFGSDQSPSNPKKAYWLRFLNQDTGVLFGAEKYAKEFNWPVIYVGMSKFKRGHYMVKYQLVSDDPSTTSHGDITKKFTQFLEKDIQEEPSNWLWTHNRWKRKKP